MRVSLPAPLVSLGFPFFGPPLGRVAVLIDGSNFLAELERCDLGYPALLPLIRQLQGKDELTYARFYSAPPITEPFKGQWLSFRAANRHIPELSFFLGYRSDGKEKAIDVALAVDLIYGCATNHFDRVSVVGGDGDHLYALKVAKSMGKAVRVFLMPGQQSGDLVAAGIPFAYLEIKSHLLGFCDRGKCVGVPVAHKAPSGHPDLTQMLRGSLADPV